MNTYLSELKSYYKRSITSKEIFLSKRFLLYLQNMAQLVSRRYGQNICVDVKYDTSIDDIAYTDNRVIVINADHSMLNKQSDDKRYYAIIGLLAHELGHLLYTDFAFIKQITDSVLSKNLTCIEPYLDHLNPEIKLAALDHPKTFAKMFRDVLNIIEDRYVEREIVKHYGGSFKKGLETVSQILAPVTAVDDNIHNLMWYQCLYELCSEVYEEKSAFKVAMNIVLTVDDTHNFGLRVGLTFEYISCLWEYLRDQFNEDSSQQSEDEEYDSDFADENNARDSKPLDISQQAEFNPGDDPVNNGMSSIEPNMPVKSFAFFLDELASDDLQNDDVRLNIENLVEREICTQICETPCHATVSATTINIKPELVDAEFSGKLAECRSISKRLQKRVVESIIERERGTRINGLSIGRRIDGRAVARGETKLFTKSIYPDKKPLLSVAVVLDESGSMSGKRIEQTQKAALVLEDFCRNLNVPLLMIGHTENNNCRVEIRNYIGFKDQRKKNDANKLAQVTSRCNNRDGFAIRYAVKKIAKRKERHRVIIVVSDGRPSASGYEYNVGKVDIQSCIEDAKRRGIAVIGVAIGEDMDQLSDIYIGGLVDARNLDSLPNALTNILVKLLK